MKQKIKIMLLLLTVAVIVSCKIAQAVSAPDSVSLCPLEPVKYREFSTGPTYYKNRGRDQKVSVDQAYTSLTNPCDSCYIGFKLDGNTTFGYIGTETISVALNQTKKFIYDHSNPEGTYTLSYTRLNFTTLNTYIGYTWYINV